MWKHNAFLALLMLKAITGRPEVLLLTSYNYILLLTDNVNIIYLF
jgi:hypothetical protein